MYVLLNDFFTAGNGVLTKKKLESKDLGKYGVIFYNAMFMLGPAIIFAWQTGDIDAVMGEEMKMSIKFVSSLNVLFQSTRAGMMAGSPSRFFSRVCSGSS